MALKGHTKIELTNVNTGEVEVYEDDNMVTNALENYFQTLGPFGKYADLLDSQSLSNFTRRFTNGLLLFDTALDDTQVNNVFPPGGVQLTGRGSTQVYDGVDKTMGSYSTQSKTLYGGHGIEYVWEFNTSQANGKIASACLTTSFGGKMGTGTKQSIDNGVTAPNDNFDARMWSNYEYTRVNPHFQLVKINPDENYCLYMPYINGSNGTYYINSNYGNYGNGSIDQTILNKSFLNTHDIIFSKYRVPFNNLSLFEYNYSPELLKTITVHLNELDDIITDAMKTYSWNSWYYNYHAFAKDRYVYFYFNYWNGNNGSSSYSSHKIYDTTANNINGYVWKINIETFEVEKFFEIKNIITGYKNGISMRRGLFYNGGNNNSSNLNFTFFITDDEFLLTEATFSSNGSTYYGICKIDLNNQTDFDWITWEKDAEIPTNWGDYYFHSFFDCNGKIYCQNTGNDYIYCIDCVDNSYYHVTNYYNYIFINDYISNIYCLKYNNYTFFLKQSYGGYARLFFMPNMLITINNLPQEIVKSPEQTMKVTYTIIDDNYKIDD